MKGVDKLRDDSHRGRKQYVHKRAAQRTAELRNTLTWLHLLVCDDSPRREAANLT